MNKEITERLEKIKELQNTIKPEVDRLFGEIKELMAKCDHKNFTNKKGGNFGNQSEEDNIYWVDVFCNDCGWTSSFYHHEDPVSYYKYS